MRSPVILPVIQCWWKEYILQFFICTMSAVWWSIKYLILKGHTTRRMCLASNQISCLSGYFIPTLSLCLYRLGKYCTVKSLSKLLLKYYQRFFSPCSWDFIKNVFYIIFDAVSFIYSISHHRISADSIQILWQNSSSSNKIHPPNFNKNWKVNEHKNVTFHQFLNSRWLPFKNELRRYDESQSKIVVKIRFF